jgi:hypothetical protein
MKKLLNYGFITKQLSLVRYFDTTTGLHLWAKEEPTLELKPKPAFKEVAQDYINSCAPKWKNQKHTDQRSKTLRNDVYLNISAIPVDQIALFGSGTKNQVSSVALLGALNTLKTSRPIILFENHKTNFENCKKVLAGYQYKLWDLKNKNILAVRAEWDFYLTDCEIVL